MGELKSILDDAMTNMYFVPSDSIEDHDQIIIYFSCMLPYYFINTLYMWFVGVTNLFEHRVEEAFEDTVTIYNSDYSTLYIGTFYEWLLKIAEFTEIYIREIDEAWHRCSTSYGVVGECGYYADFRLFFDSSMAWDEYYGKVMTVFAPMTENAFEDEAAEIPQTGFELDPMFIESTSSADFCSSLDKGVKIFGTLSNLPEDVLGPDVTLSAYSIDVI